MSVYVDDMRVTAKVGRVRANARWSHLMADTHEELEAFARRLGLRPEWIQKQGRRTEHYDVTDTVRAKALELGAVSIRYPSGTADLIERKRLREALDDTP